MNFLTRMCVAITTMEPLIGRTGPHVCWCLCSISCKFFYFPMEAILVAGSSTVNIAIVSFEFPLRTFYNLTPSERDCFVADP